MTPDDQSLLEEKYNGTPSDAFEEDKKRLTEGEPLAYVIGWQPFLGLKIYLDSKPLIPRPETEWWTEQLIEEIQSESTPATLRVGLGLAARSARNVVDVEKRQLQMLDLCSGSGAIGCAMLAQIPGAQIYFGEIDPAHEAIILKNIRKNNLDESRSDIRIGNLFEPFGDMTFDVIAINPPYVLVNRTLSKSVIDYEPPLALYAGKDGLDLIRRIATELPQYLTKDGIAWIECDSEHADAASELFKAQGFHAEIRNDQYDRPRTIVVSFP